MFLTLRTLFLKVWICLLCTFPSPIHSNPGWSNHAWDCSLRLKHSAIRRWHGPPNRDPLDSCKPAMSTNQPYGMPQVAKHFSVPPKQFPKTFTRLISLASVVPLVISFVNQIRWGLRLLVCPQFQLTHLPTPLEYPLSSAPPFLPHTSTKSTPQMLYLGTARKELNITYFL